jgi:hypothetical protein
MPTFGCREVASCPACKHCNAGKSPKLHSACRPKGRRWFSFFPHDSRRSAGHGVGTPDPVDRRHQERADVELEATLAPRPNATSRQFPITNSKTVRVGRSLPACKRCNVGKSLKSRSTCRSKSRRYCSFFPHDSRRNARHGVGTPDPVDRRHQEHAGVEPEATLAPRPNAMSRPFPITNSKTVRVGRSLREVRRIQFPPARIHQFT